MPKKKKRDIELFIVDVFVAIIKIKGYTSPFENEDDFHHNSLHWDATIRQLEVIGEALKNLLEDEYFSSLSPKYFRKIVNFRNAIVHGYFGIDSEEVWDVVSAKINLLNDDLKDIVNSSTIDLEYALEATIDEYSLLNDHNIIEFLKTIGSVQDINK